MKRMHHITDGITPIYMNADNDMLQKIAPLHLIEILPTKNICNGPIAIKMTITDMLFKKISISNVYFFKNRRENHIYNLGIRIKNSVPFPFSVEKEISPWKPTTIFLTIGRHKLCPQLPAENLIENTDEISTSSNPQSSVEKLRSQ